MVSSSFLEFGQKKAPPQFGVTAQEYCPVKKALVNLGE
jgi:hypothetical protein